MLGTKILIFLEKFPFTTEVLKRLKLFDYNELSSCAAIGPIVRRQWEEKIG